MSGKKSSKDQINGTEELCRPLSLGLPRVFSFCNLQLCHDQDFPQQRFWFVCSSCSCLSPFLQTQVCLFSPSIPTRHKGFLPEDTGLISYLMHSFIHLYIHWLVVLSFGLPLSARSLDTNQNQERAEGTRRHIVRWCCLLLRLFQKSPLIAVTGRLSSSFPVKTFRSLSSLLGHFFCPSLWWTWPPREESQMHVS